MEALSKQYGGVRAVDGVSFSVYSGQFGLIGPNGAGKTTLFEMISGFVVPDSGTVTFAGKDVTALAPEIKPSGNLAILPIRSTISYPHHH